MLAVIGLSALALVACAPERANDKVVADWQTDPMKAIEAARQQNRLLFIAFLGSDWSTASQGAMKDVLDTRAFKELADTNFVLLKLDFSRKGLTPEEAQGYASLAKQLQVDHFPMFLIADPAHGVGTFSRINTYGGGGVLEFVDQISTIMKEYRQVLASRMAEAQAQGQAGIPAPPPTLPRVTGDASFPSPQQMLQQPSVNPAPVNSQSGVSSGTPAGFPSVQDMLNKAPASTVTVPSPASAGNTDGPMFQLK